MLVRMFDNGKDLGSKPLTSNTPEWEVLLKVKEYIKISLKDRGKVYYSDQFTIKRIFHDGKDAMLFTRAVTIECLPVISGNYFLTFHERFFRGICHDFDEIRYKNYLSSLEYVFEFTEKEIIGFLGHYFTTSRLEEERERIMIMEEMREYNEYDKSVKSFLEFAEDVNNPRR